MGGCTEATPDGHSLTVTRFRVMYRILSGSLLMTFPTRVSCLSSIKAHCVLINSWPSCAMSPSNLIGRRNDDCREGISKVRERDSKENTAINWTWWMIRHNNNYYKYDRYSLEGQIVYRIDLEVVLIPKVVTTGMEVSAIYGNNFCMIPWRVSPPRSNPHVKICILRQMRREFV